MGDRDGRVWRAKENELIKTSIDAFGGPTVGLKRYTQELH